MIYNNKFLEIDVLADLEEYQNDYVFNEENEDLTNQDYTNLKTKLENKDTLNEKDFEVLRTIISIYFEERDLFTAEEVGIDRFISEEIDWQLTETIKINCNESFFELDVILSYDYAQDAEVYFFDGFIEINKTIENPLRNYNQENDKPKKLSNAQKMIKAIKIFESYDSKMSFHCEHDSLAICSNVIDEETVSEDDILKLSDLGFFWSNEDFGWMTNGV